MVLYGARYAKTHKLLYKNGAHPDDLWKTYFTSSDLVFSFRKEFGEPDIIEVRRIFQTVEDTLSWERKVLKRMKVRFSDNWLNKTDSAGIPISIIISSNQRRIYTDETKKKMSVSIKNNWSKRKADKAYNGGNRKGLSKRKNILTGEIRQLELLMFMITKSGLVCQ